MRVLGIDFGDRNIGLALSDPLGISAQPLETYRTRNDAETARHFRELVERYRVSEIVIGLPLRLDGTPGSRVEKTRAFAAWLGAAVGLPVQFWDERLTTHQALQSVREQKVKIKDRKSVINQISATIILQAYLDSRRPDAGSPEDR